MHIKVFKLKLIFFFSFSYEKSCVSTGGVSLWSIRGKSGKWVSPPSCVSPETPPRTPFCGEIACETPDPRSCGRTGYIWHTSSAPTHRMRRWMWAGGPWGRMWSGGFWTSAPARNGKRCLMESGRPKSACHRPRCWMPSDCCIPE